MDFTSFGCKPARRHTSSHIARGRCAISSTAALISSNRHQRPPLLTPAADGRSTLGIRCSASSLPHAGPSTTFLPDQKLLEYVRVYTATDINSNVVSQQHAANGLPRSRALQRRTSADKCLLLTYKLTDRPVALFIFISRMRLRIGQRSHFRLAAELPRRSRAATAVHGRPRMAAARRD